MNAIVPRERAGIRLALWATLVASVFVATFWSCATGDADKPITPTSATDKPDVIRTTIRIVKGKVGYPSLWTATTGASETSVTLGGGQPIPPDLWTRMNGIVESFTEYGCDGEPTALVEPLYTVLNEKGGPEGVKVVGEVGEKPDWGPVYCDSTGCFLPAYYFNKVEKDPRACLEGGSERHWDMVLY
ncbi:MAG: hypothetical protein MUF27_12820 [Acidobacteria bacterium]|jgi:hypothetical protein|nr:hypothetical protein [Acidobacteriota bacterium]